MNHLEEPLNRHNLLLTRDLSELESFLTTMYLKLDAPLSVLRKPTRDSVINAFNLPHTCISFLRFPAAVELMANSDYPFFNISLPKTGSFTLNVAGTEVTGDKHVGGMVSPVYEKRLILHQNNSRINLSFAQHAVIRMLETMLGEPLSAPLYFSPKVELSRSGGRKLKALVDMMVNDADTDTQSYSNSVVSTHFEQLLISILLTSQPHNYSSILMTPMPSPAPRDVKRVIDYIHAHLQEPITLEKLITVSEVPGRSLFAHFRKFIGKSPLQYVAEQRLLRARQDLLCAEYCDSVTEIAMRWGFNQLGRFSGLYRKTYGELPSETLKRTIRGSKKSNYFH